MIFFQGNFSLFRKYSLFYYKLYFKFYQLFEGFYVIKKVKRRILFLMKVIKKLLLFILLFLLLGVTLAVGYYYAVTKSTSLDPSKLLFSEKTITLYDKNGAEIHTPNAARQATKIEDISPFVKQAFIAVEDRRFYKHGGYDMKGVLRATFHNLKSKSFEQGASTISQQLIKNTHLSQEKTVKRKLKEFKLTRELEKRYSKKEILERYLNTIYFGHSCFGITSAAEFYFGKSPAELSLAESALLAGLAKSPNYYSPVKNPENAKKRRNVVLSCMLETGSITVNQKENACKEALPTSPFSHHDGGYISFVFDELSAIAEEKGFTIGGKMQIHTYLDGDLQAALEEIASSYTESDKSIFVLDGKTRGFKGCVSTLGNLPRLPGSALKPLLVYAPAIEENILSPATPILDEKINFNGYSPENYDGGYHGYVSARECVEKSLNIPAVKVLQSLTLPKATAYLEKLNLPVSEEDKSLALALGGMKNGYTLKDLTGGYAALQSGGVYSSCGFISSIKVGNTLLYKKPTEGKRVFSEETAYLTTDMLRTTVENGTAKKLRSLPFEIAAKTGTVGTKKGNTDGYALSYTTKDCVSVWLGNADYSPVSCTGGGAPCNLLYQVNAYLYATYKEKGEKINAFAACKNIVKTPLDKTAYYENHTLSIADERSPETERIYELFKASALPLNKCTAYSAPTILPPSVEVEGNRVKILFDARSPKYYSYKIERYDFQTKVTIYSGEYIGEFYDEVLSNKNYQYVVTPYYKEQAGEPVILPTITTKQGDFTPQEQEILSKEWWKE